MKKLTKKKLKTCYKISEVIFGDIEDLIVDNIQNTDFDKSDFDNYDTMILIENEIRKQIKNML